MKRFLFVNALALTGAVLLAGCGSRSTSAVEDSETPAVPQFSAKKGLFLPDQTRQSLGLKLVEVEERKLTSTLEVELRVYRKERASAFTSGAVAPEQANLLKAGRTVDVRLPDGGRRTGEVTSVSDQLQRATGSAEVLVEIPNTPEALTVGTFVRASVPSESNRSVVTIPRAALLGCSEGDFVYTASGEHLVRTAVKVGASNAEYVEITDGLYVGDQVVLQPVMSLWMTELAAVKGGQACCIEPPKGK
jgi:hypothetical protein